MTPGAFAPVRSRLPVTPRPEVEVWLTTADQAHLLERRDDVVLGAHGAPVTITVDDHRERQRMQGFGASFTESAAVLVHDRLGPGRRDEVMRRLFDPEAGIGLSLLRQPMGASDFAVDSYTYDDVPDGDPDLSAFSVARPIYVTECSGGDWSPDFADNLRWGVDTLIIESIRHGAGAVVPWNVALDQDAGPTNGGCQDCRGVVTVDTTTGGVTYNVECYVLGHASRFVAPGAVHLASTDDAGAGAGADVEHVAFRNSDGTHALIVLNSAGEPQTFGVRCSDAWFGYRLPAGAVATFTWG